MKIFHLSDLHLGKKLNEFSLIEDQAFILEQIINLAQVYRPEVLLLSGDIYDRSQPPAEAVQLLDEFVTRLAEQKIQIMLIGGNHDGSARLGFGSRLLSNSGVYLAPVFNGSLQPLTLADEYGKINFYLLPFFKPATIRPFFPEQEITSYNQALQVILEQTSLNLQQRNILLAHQFIRGALSSESEELTIGNLEQIDGELLSGFDYVALGHLHHPQNVTAYPNGQPQIRYCGSPLKYAISEGNKSLTYLDFQAKNCLESEFIELKPLRDLRKLRGSYAELTDRSFYQNSSLEDFFQITLTDEQDIFAALDKLRTIYPRILKLEYDNQRTRQNQQLSQPLPEISPLELFEQFFQAQNNQVLSAEQRQYLLQLWQEIKEEK